ncbi:Glucoamylase, intracellular sporulation-specific [Arthrobotrys conoides]|uniref:glucan 1,4-alpha-glucosidase n=1 Tax=Arthrobotrys conoides TaxID=74498 RepID=A0AAN8NJC8_9PEZI
MRFNFKLSTLVGALCVFLTCANAGVIEKRAREAYVREWQHGRDHFLSGNVTILNLGPYKNVEIFYATIQRWEIQPIAASRFSGPDRDGWEQWVFNGWAPNARWFYLRYTVNRQYFYDPPQGYYYSIPRSGEPVTTRTPIPPPTISTRTPIPPPIVSTRTPIVDPIVTTRTAVLPPIVTGPGRVRIKVAVKKTPTLENWLASEYTFAEAALKRNIGSSQNTKIPKGVVVASPSTHDPNYWYQWIRDASTVMEHVVGNYLRDGSDLEYIKDWIESQEKLQKVDNPSGGFSTGGLGEPKFHVDGSAFTESWGRPQRDGPPLRANTLMKFANAYIKVDGDYVRNKLQAIIKADLEYVVSYWSHSSFDLWEEIQGQHYFTIIVAYRSMIEGAEFAKLMGDNSAAEKYKKTAESMVSTIKGFWRADKGYIVETHNIHGRSGLDCGVLLGALKAPYIFKPSGEEVLATTEALISTFQNLYVLNRNARGPGFGIGRYPEDTYDGHATTGEGNPWFICTATVAHVLYTAASEFKAAQSINVTPAALNLFKRAYPSAAPGNYNAGSQEFNNIISSFKSLGDAFMAVIQRHSFTEGNMSEQFNRYSGFNQGARDLTWSYESVLEAIVARNMV